MGPFVWTPNIVNHECLVAVVHGPNDPSIAPGLIDSVDHWKVVRFDNNVGQRNVSPQAKAPGGKTKTGFFMRGTTQPSTNSLIIDASPYPSDTKIQVRMVRRVVDSAESISEFIVTSQNERWSYLKLPGGKTGEIKNFPLGTNEETTVSLEIDFSHHAEHLKVYSLVATQVQDGEIVGRITIDIKAVKETEDYIWGNLRSKEMHLVNCEFWKKVSPKNKVVFESPKDGIARGYNGCAYCMKDYDTG